MTHEDELRRKQILDALHKAFRVYAEGDTEAAMARTEEAAVLIHQEMRMQEVAKAQAEHEAILKEMRDSTHTITRSFSR